MVDNKIDLVVSFDTTGSMYPVIATVRRVVDAFVKEMFGQFSSLRIGIIAHGDYCDKDNPYTIIYKELSRDEDSICKFVRDVKSTYGGDADECYELVLNLVASDSLGWREDAEKIFIMIGDASPHSPSYRDNVDNLDWRKEADELARQGIKVFAVHALAGYRSSTKSFYTTVAEKTLGTYLTLDMFNEIVDLIKAAVYQRGGEEKLSEFITIIKDTGRMTNSMNRNIRRLKGEVIEDDYRSYSGGSRSSSWTSHGTDGKIKEMDDLVPVTPGRFQVMEVEHDCDIKSFVTNMGITFKKGRGFYELSKAETVQQYKEVIMQNRETGEMFTGKQVREKLGLQPQTEHGGVNERIHAAAAKDFRVFIQSTSVNRKLIAGKMFLYEVGDLTYDGTTIEKSEEPVKAVEAVKKEEPVKAVEAVKKEEPVKAVEAVKKEEAVAAVDVEKKGSAPALVAETTETTEKKVVAGEHTLSEVTSPFEDEPMADKDTREKVFEAGKTSDKAGGKADEASDKSVKKSATKATKPKKEADPIKERYGITTKQLEKKVDSASKWCAKVISKAEAFQSVEKGKVKKADAMLNCVDTTIAVLQQLAEALQIEE